MLTTGLQALIVKTMLVKKDALKPSRYYLRDGRVFDVYPEDMPHYAQRLRDMTKSGLHIPITWEHQPSVKPFKNAEDLADRVKLTLGHVHDVSLDKSVLEVKFDAPNPEDQKKLPAIKYVSPYIEMNYTDPSGKTWPGPSITHIAVTNNPVQTDQKPFQMSNNPLDLWSKGVALSMADIKEKKVGKEEDDEDQEVYGETPEATDGVPVPQEDETAPEEEGDEEGEEGEEVEDEEIVGDASKMGKVVTYLGHLGLMLPPETAPENFLDRLYTAVLTKLAADDPAAAMNQDQTETYGMTSAAKEANPPIVMSHNDPKLLAREKRLIDLERAGLKSRLEALFAKGRITPAIKQKLEESLSAVALSLADDGSLANNDFMIRLQAYEELPENISFPVGDVREVPLSQSGLADDKEAQKKRRQEVIDIAAPKRKK